mgnify:CR=1 FL=1
MSLKKYTEVSKVNDTENKEKNSLEFPSKNNHLPNADKDSKDCRMAKCIFTLLKKCALTLRMRKALKEALQI